MSTTLPGRVIQSAPTTHPTRSKGSNRGPVHSHQRKDAAKFWKKPLVWLLAAGGILLLFTAVSTVAGNLGESDQPLIFYPVPRGDLAIDVTERGNLESQEETEITCEVENVSSSRNGNNGTQIISIVDNGSQVKKGDLLIELDSAPLKEMLDQQYLETEEDRAALVQAQVKFENQKSLNATALAEAELAVELADLELKMYGDDDEGTYQITKREMELEVQEAKNQITEANANLAMQTTELEGISMLYKLGYKGRGELTQAKLSHLKAQGALVKAKNQLAKEASDVLKLSKFERRMEMLRLQGALETAKRTVDQVKEDNKAAMAEAQSDLLSAKRRVAREEERLARYQAQIEKCKIYAPHDGMVVYATERSRYNRSGETIGEGVLVRERQKLLTLPDLSRMQVKTAVHESVLDQVRPGLPVTVRIDAFPDRPYRGSVKSVAVLPDQGGWLSSDIKVYETIITIDGTIEHLKPGMTAVVEIHVDRLKDVLSIPVQAVVQIDGQNWCYVEAPRGVERRMLTLGQTNDKFVHVVEGLEEGMRVVLNPMAIVDESQRNSRDLSPDARRDDTERATDGTDEAGEDYGKSEAASTGERPSSRGDVRKAQDAPPKGARPREGAGRRRATRNRSDL